MSRLIFLIFSVILIKKSEQFMCDENKIIQKCLCNQNPENLNKIPLFNIDCSRLNFEESLPENILPVLMGRYDVSHNKIIYLNETTKLTNNYLYYLDYSYNKIKYISKDYFNNLTSLEELNLKHNKLTTITADIFNNLLNLKTLNLQGNQLTTLPNEAFLKLTKLKTLTLSYNNLGKFIQKNGLGDYVPGYIEALYLDHINLTELNPFIFQQQKILNELSIAYNPINELTYLPLNHLEFYDISGTNLTNITTKGLSYPHLKVLKMNRISYLSNITEFSFYNLMNLEELYMEHCIRLKNIGAHSFALTLKKFSVAYSGLTTLPPIFESYFEKMEEIQLRGNFWHCDCKLSWFKRLKNNVKDLHQVRCSTPESEENKTVQTIAESLTCLKPKQKISVYKPIHSWLFPLVGVLSIIVLILVIILIFMGPYGKKTNKIFLGNPGSMSPYQPISIQPNQAEHIYV